MNAIYFLTAAATFLLWSGCGKSPVKSVETQPIQIAELPKPNLVESTPLVEAPAAKVLEPSSRVIVLGYHRFVNNVRRPDTEITPQVFESQLNALKENGISVISLKDFMAWKRGEKSLPPVCALITIDDGYKSAYTVAWPILKKFEYPFTLFVYTTYVKGGAKSGGESITWEQLAEMRDAGVEIQSHTVSHRDLRGKRGNNAANPAYEKWLWAELHDSKALIEERLGVKVIALAVPYGGCNEHIKETSAKAGYELLFTVDGQKIGAETPSNAVGRYMIESNKPKVFADAIVFDSGGSGAGPAAVAVKALRTEPEDGAILSVPPMTLRADLGSFGVIDPGSVTMRMSGTGPLPAVYNPQTKTIAYLPVKPLKADKYAVIVSATSQGRKVETRWTFVVEQGHSPISVLTVQKR
ncbi:MAG: Polysaccharide deacetylase [Chthoniobacteraceae bacterium]|nr:Polysaccharide deacetylase [Chthoniobacteraceae bacterium]